MVSRVREVIDLTESPKPEVIVLDSDTEPAISSPRKRKPSSSRDANKFTLLDRLTDANGEKIRPDVGESSKSGDVSKGKKRKKRKRKASIVEEGGVVVEEIEGEDEDEDGRVEEKTNGHATKGKEKDDGRSPNPSRTSSSLLDRITGIERPPESSSSKPKSLDPPSRSEEDPRDAERNSKKRKRKDRDKERDKERNRGRSRSPQSSRRRRSRSSDRKRDENAPSAPMDSSLFFIDVEPVHSSAPAKVPIGPQPMPNGPNTRSIDEEKPTEPKLLLPAHVTVVEDIIGPQPAEILPPTPLDSDEESYIDYLDDDDDRKACIWFHALLALRSDMTFQVPGLVRYFDDPSERPAEGESKSKRLVCKNCGMRNDHKTFECRTVVVSTSPIAYLSTLMAVNLFITNSA